MRRRDTRRMARADILWGAIGFVALQVGLVVAARLWLPELHDPYYAYKAARLHERTVAVAVAERPVTVTMLGSSRTAFGFRAATLQDRLAKDFGRPAVAFNFGMYGAGPITSLLILHRLLDDGLRPDLLLVEVIPAHLCGQPGAVGEMASFSPTRLWLDEAPLLEQCGVPADGFRRDWWKANLVPWYGYRYAVVSRVAPRWLPGGLRQNFGQTIDECGWEPLPVVRPTPEGRQAAVEITRKSFASTLEGFRLGGASCQALHDLLALCKTEHLRTALVVMPESSEFRGWYPPAARAEINVFLSDLSHEFAVPLVDANTWMADDDFSDGHHLLADAAAAFSERLTPVVASLLAPVTQSKR
jgi:hypothetical protein